MGDKSDDCLVTYHNAARENDLDDEWTPAGYNCQRFIANMRVTQVQVNKVCAFGGHRQEWNLTSEESMIAGQIEVCEAGTYALAEYNFVDYICRYRYVYIKIKSIIYTIINTFLQFISCIFWLLQAIHKIPFLGLLTQDAKRVLGFEFRSMPWVYTPVWYPPSLYIFESRTQVAA